VGTSRLSTTTTAEARARRSTTAGSASIPPTHRSTSTAATKTTTPRKLPTVNRCEVASRAATVPSTENECVVSNSRPYESVART
jgi:hypothetical protein